MYLFRTYKILNAFPQYSHGARLAPWSGAGRPTPPPAPQPLGRPAPPRRSLPRSPFRSPKSPATFEEVYAGEPLPPPSPPVRGARVCVPLSGAPPAAWRVSVLAVPGPRSRPRDVCSESLSACPTGGIILIFYKNYSTHFTSRKFLMRMIETP